ncbi:hypothetical protein J3D64_004153 [Priestia megaterium]|nr:hypothetical protein [Priestia megaterium]
MGYKRKSTGFSESVVKSGISFMTNALSFALIDDK